MCILHFTPLLVKYFINLNVDQIILFKRYVIYLNF